jgi:FkbM family methyltransferase
MKKAIKKFLITNGLYYPLRYSFIFHLYQLLFKPHDISQQRREVAFYRSFLGSCDLIFDIGANDGHKTEAFLKLGDKVVCCEPDDLNHKILRVRFRHRKKKVFIENKALLDTTGYAEFYIHHPGSAVNTLSAKWKELLETDNKKKWNQQISFSDVVKTETTTLDILISKYGVPDFIKIDVEGSESLVLQGLTQRVACLSFETLLPNYIAEMRDCLSAINKLDRFATYNIAKDEKLLFPDFVSQAELEKWTNGYPKDPYTFEIIAKINA